MKKVYCKNCKYHEKKYTPIINEHYSYCSKEGGRLKINFNIMPFEFIHPKGCEFKTNKEVK